MKKFTVIIACFAVMVCLASCNSDIVDNTSIYGTWNAVGALIEGSEFTVSEIEALGDDSLNGLVLVIKEGGKVYARNDEFDEMLDLVQNGNEFTIGELRAYIKDGQLYWENEEYTVILTKSSESQMITIPSANSTPVHSPQNQPSPTDSQIANNTPVSTPTVSPSAMPTPTQNPLPKNDAEWLALAKKIVETQFLSRPETVMELINNGCSIEKAEQYVFYCDVDWNVSTVKTLERLCNNPDNFIPSYLYDLMDDLNFLYEEIDYAFENADVDWFSRALPYADELLKEYEGEQITPDLLYDYLGDYWYDYSTIMDVIENCGVDWLETAQEIINPYINYTDYDYVQEWVRIEELDVLLSNEFMFPYDIVETVLDSIDWESQEIQYVRYLSDFHLVNSDYEPFSRSHASSYYMLRLSSDLGKRIYLLENSGIDWNQHALCMANWLWECYYSEESTTSEILDDVKWDMEYEYCFESSEIDYAIKNMTKSR